MTAIRADAARPGDRVWLGDLDGSVYTIARSGPDDLNDGWWHLETAEADATGWPVSLRCPPGHEIEREAAP